MHFCRSIRSVVTQTHTSGTSSWPVAPFPGYRGTMGGGL